MAGRRSVDHSFVPSKAGTQKHRTAWGEGRLRSTSLDQFRGMCPGSALRFAALVRDDTIWVAPLRSHSTAAYTRFRTSVRVYCRCPGPCIMNTANRSSCGSIQKKVPAMPLQKYWPAGPRDGGMPPFRRPGKAEPETVAGGHEFPLDLDLRREMIGGHQLQRLAADDALAIERAAGKQHLAEAGIVHGGRNQPAAAGF